MTNGGTGPYRSSLLLVTSGRGPRPPSIALVNSSPPYNVTVLLDNFFGRQFNSLNDIKVHPSGKLFFTDVMYAALLCRYGSAILLPFSPDTGISTNSVLHPSCERRCIGSILILVLYVSLPTASINAMVLRSLKMERLPTCKSARLFRLA